MWQEGTFCVSVLDKTCPRSQNSSYVCTRPVFRALLPRVCTDWRLWRSLEVTLQIFGKEVYLKIDSGADTSITSEETCNAMRPRPRPKLKSITTTLLGVGGPLESKGQFIAHTEVMGQYCQVPSEMLGELWKWSKGFLNWMLLVWAWWFTETQWSPRQDAVLHD